MRQVEKKKTSQRERTANELTNVRDIKNNNIYTKDGYIIKFLRLYELNIHLLSNAEKVSKCDILTGAFKGENKRFSILSIPRSIDMEDYINHLTMKHDEEMENANRKMLLRVMINEATKKIMSATNFEHQCYLMLWEKEKVDGIDKQVEIVLETRMHDFENRYAAIQNATKELDDTDLLRLCNLFGNSNTALFDTYESDNQYTPIPWIKGKA